MIDLDNATLLEIFTLSLGFAVMVSISYFLYHISKTLIYLTGVFIKLLKLKEKEHGIPYDKRIDQ